MRRSHQLIQSTIKEEEEEEGEIRWVHCKTSDSKITTEILQHEQSQGGRKTYRREKSWKAVFT